MSTLLRVKRALVSAFKTARDAERNKHIRRWHVLNLNSNHCTIGSGQILYRFLTGKHVSDEKLTALVESIADDGEKVSEDGATLAVVLKALRKLGAKFSYETIREMKTTRRLEGKVLACGHEEWGDPHAILLYRENGVCWLLDSVNPMGACIVSDERALELIENSDADCFLISRRNSR